MELRNFLQRMLNFGRDSGHFNIIPIGNLEKNCCPYSKTEVIDFDATKDKICKEANLQTFKSCDALKVLPKLKRLDFIELKGFRQFIKRNNPNEKQIDKQIKKFDLVDKIIASNNIIYLLIHNKNNQLEKYDRTHYQKIEKNYIILVDIELEDNGIENIALTLNFLSETSTPIDKLIMSKLNIEITDIDANLVPSLNQPMLKSCKDIDDFYEGD
ncbi:hypothetical protein QUF74_11015 [Candidatus Halobeggiatoa sp. HSG11]|nr:hypothetical protein [Candidatus Halobeggiatoa sp. HSG11]